MGLDEAADDCETQAQAALRTLRVLPFLDEQVEHVRQHLGRDTATRVGHPHHDLGLFSRG